MFLGKKVRSVFYLPTFFTLFLVFGLFCRVSLAVIPFEDAVFPELITSGRALAMGDAFIAKTDDSDAVFYNPAGLGTVRALSFHLANIHLEMNRGLMRSSTEGRIDKVGQNFIKGFEMDGTRQLLLQNRGTIAHSRFHLMPNFTLRYFSIGYMYSTQSVSFIGEENDAKFEFSERTDNGPFIAGNLSFMGGVFKVGLSAVILSRKQINDERNRDAAIKLNGEDYRKGSTVILTLGTKFTFPVALLPTFAATLHNASSNSFKAKGSVGEPPEIAQNLVLGFAVTPNLGNVVRLHLEVNYKDFKKRYKSVSSFRKINFGGELDIARRLYIRAGLGDGWGSGGIGLRAPRMEFELTSYAIDASAGGFRGIEDRRFVFSLSYGFGRKRGESPNVIE